ncbi:MAG: hypothetical protein AAB657_01520 [Patescibacteria group bacterium]
MKKLILTKNEEQLYLQSMSIFLHTMRTSVTRDFISSLKSLTTDNSNKEEFKRIEDSFNKMFILCELIPIIAEIETSSSFESVKFKLLQTSFFAEVRSKDPEIVIFSNTFEETSKIFYSRTGYKLKLINHNEKKLIKFFGKNGLFPTTLFYKIMFEHLLEEIRQTTLCDENDALDVELITT